MANIGYHQRVIDKSHLQQIPNALARQVLRIQENADSSEIEFDPRDRT